jgi:hypothetical protein
LLLLVLISVGFFGGILYSEAQEHNQFCSYHFQDVWYDVIASVSGNMSNYTIIDMMNVSGYGSGIR